MRREKQNLIPLIASSPHPLISFLMLAIITAFAIAQSDQLERQPAVTFTDITDQAGIKFRHFSGAFGHKYMPETMGSGCAFFDYNDDGRLDILFVNGTRWSERRSDPETTLLLYRNLGDGSFDDVTQQANLAKPMYGMGCAVADYDNDGDADIYLTNLGKNILYRNEGDGSFVEVTELAKVGDESWSTSAAFFDYDKDSYLDLFVCNYVKWTPESDIWCSVDGINKSYCTPGVYQGESCSLYRNLGDGSFEDVTQAAGVFNPEGKSLGVALVDFNADGWLDIAVANDTEPNLLHRNNGDGSFTEEAVLRGLAFDENGRARGGMGIDVADYLNNGKLAISIGNFSNERLAFFYESDDSYFSDEALRVGVGAISFLYLTFGLFFFDYDLDGYLDLFAANGHIETDVSQIQPSLSYAQRPLLFKSLGSGRFIELAQECGDLARAGVSRGAAYGDYDLDGDLDILVSNNGVYHSGLSSQ